MNGTSDTHHETATATATSTSSNGNLQAESQIHQYVSVIQLNNRGIHHLEQQEHSLANEYLSQAFKLSSQLTRSVDDRHPQDRQGRGNAFDFSVLSCCMRYSKDLRSSSSSLTSFFTKKGSDEDAIYHQTILIPVEIIPSSSPSSLTQFGMALSVAIIFNLALVHQLIRNEATSTTTFSKSTTASTSPSGDEDDTLQLLVHKSIRLYQLAYELVTRRDLCITWTTLSCRKEHQLLVMAILTNLSHAFTKVQDAQSAKQCRQKLRWLLSLFLYYSEDGDSDNQCNYTEECELFLICSGLLQQPQDSNREQDKSPRFASAA